MPPVLSLVPGGVEDFQRSCKLEDANFKDEFQAYAKGTNATKARLGKKYGDFAVWDT